MTLKLRPWLFGEDGTHLGDIDLSYDRSERDSVRYFDYVDQVSLGWVPSTTKLGPGVLNFGYANIYLDQDDFTPFAIDRGFERGG